MTHIDSGPDDGPANELRLDHLLLELGIFLRHGARVEPHIRIHLAGPEKKLDEAFVNVFSHHRTKVTLQT